MKVGILQFQPRLGDVAANLETIRFFLQRRSFDLAVLPELATTGYNFVRLSQVRDLAEDHRGQSFAAMSQLAEKTGGAIVWGMVERSRNRLYNTAVLTTPEGDHHRYRKTHLFFREKLFFEPGNTGFEVFTWRGVRIGMMICFDWIFPEAARTLALKGCQIICHPANLVMPYCQDAMVTRSLENGLFCVTANRTGRETAGRWTFRFTGLSQITDPQGRRIARFSRVEQVFRTVKIRPEAADTKTVNRLNSLFADRRTDYYRL
jgi:predicted amidohydrolase